MTTLFIKNMVCNRCIMVVQSELEKLGLGIKKIKLGEVVLEKPLDSEQKHQVHHADNEPKMNLSDILCTQLNHDYNYLSNLFSEVEGTTIEKYFIAQKIEKVKELLVYDELSLSEIAHRLNYSSVAYLSNQFKKVTGLTPSYFKQIKEDKRKPLDHL